MKFVTVWDLEDVQARCGPHWLASERSFSLQMAS